MKNEQNTRKMRSIFRNSFFFLAAAAVHTPAHLVECSPNEQQREECGKISKAFGTFFYFFFFSHTTFFLLFASPLCRLRGLGIFFLSFNYGISLTLAPQDDVEWGRHTRRLVKVATRISLHTFSHAHSAQIAIISNDFGWDGWKRGEE